MCTCFSLLTQAHIQAYIVEIFVNRLVAPEEDDIPDDAKAVVTAMCRLYAINLICQNSGDFLEVRTHLCSFKSVLFSPSASNDACCFGQTVIFFQIVLHNFQWTNQFVGMVIELGCQIDVIQGWLYESRATGDAAGEDAGVAGAD